MSTTSGCGWEAHRGGQNSLLIVCSQGFPNGEGECHEIGQIAAPPLSNDKRNARDDSAQHVTVVYAYLGQPHIEQCQPILDGLQSKAAKNEPDA